MKNFELITQYFIFIYDLIQDSSFKTCDSSLACCITYTEHTWLN